MRITTSLAMAVCLCFSHFAYAKAPLTQADIGVYSELLTCGMSFQLFLVNGDRGYKQCLLDGKVKIKKQYETSLKTVKKPAARAALKEYYIFGVTALLGIEPQSEERKINYEKRQGDNQNKLDEMWVRFEAEN
jgi:hypothetical protein